VDGLGEFRISEEPSYEGVTGNQNTVGPETKRSTKYGNVKKQKKRKLNCQRHKNENEKSSQSEAGLLSVVVEREVAVALRRREDKLIEEVEERVCKRMITRLMGSSK